MKTTKIQLIIFISWVFATTLKAQDRPVQHGMLLMGSQTIYATNFPSFQGQNSYQIIVELRLDIASKEIYQESSKKFPKETTYTLQTERFVLIDLLYKPRPFKVNIYRGHFEKGGEEIVLQGTATIQRIVYLKKLDARVSQPLDYNAILFGNSNEQFIAHLVTTPPDFNQVCAIKIKENEILARLREASFLPVVFENTPNNTPLDDARLSGRTTLGGVVFKTSNVKPLFRSFADLRGL